VQRHAKSHLSLRAVGAEQAAFEKRCQRGHRGALAQTHHGLELSALELLAGGEQVVQRAQRSATHARLQRFLLEGQAGSDAPFDVVHLQHRGHECHLVYAGVEHVIDPGDQRLLAETAAAVEIAMAWLVGLGQELVVAIRAAGKAAQGRPQSVRIAERTEREPLRPGMRWDP